MTEQLKIQPGDILVNINRGKDLWSKIRRCAVGPYSHVFLYLGQLGLFAYRRQPRILRAPMMFESNGRGVCLRLLSERYGEDVVVMRLKSEHDRRRIPSVLTEAIKLASDEGARYDYWCIVSFIIPRILAQKLHLPLPLKYNRDPFMVCSEAVMEVFLRAKIEILLPGVVPLPGDFVDSPLLEKMWRGSLSAEVV